VIVSVTADSAYDGEPTDAAAAARQRSPPPGACCMDQQSDCKTLSSNFNGMPSMQARCR